MTQIKMWLDRVDAVEKRLERMARPIDGLTSADPASGERWEGGQVWGHLSEFVDFWVPQVQTVIDRYQGDPIPFGRQPGDSRKVDSLEAGKTTPPEVSWQALQSDLGRLRDFISALSDRGLDSVGLHARIGPMDMEAMMQRFLVGHLEEHATQLEEIHPA